MQAHTDAELVAAYGASGDEAAFAEIVSRHGAMVYRVCLGLVGDPHEAEDCSQAAFVVLVRKAPSLRSGEGLAAWLYGVARRVCLRAVRDRAGRARREEGAAMIRRSVQEEAARAAAEVPELLELACREMEAIPQAERQAVILRYLEGRSEEEAAALAGCPQGTLSRRASTGLARLRERLAGKKRLVAPEPLAELFRSGAGAVVPATLVSSLLAAPKLAAAGGAAGSGNAVLNLAEGTMKAMFWAKAKLALAVAASAVALAATVSAAANGIMGPATPDLTRGGGGEPRPLEAAAPADAGGGAKFEHFAFSGNVDYLDGPRLEALGAEKGRLITNDEEGNWYVTIKYSTCQLRCIRVDGQIETIVGDDRWNGLTLEEGPAAYFPHMGMGARAGDLCIPGRALAVYGLPLKGEEQGRIYLYLEDHSPYRIYKNKEKNDRWWFKRVGAPGKGKPPATVGQTVKLDETDMTDAKIGCGWIEWEGNMYTFDEAKGEMTCVLTMADYQAKAEEALGRKNLGPAEYMTRAADGTMYLLYYWKTYPSGQVFRVPPDRSKVELIAADNREMPGGGNLDGPGLRTRWHCGPAFIETSGNTLFLRSVDSTAVRRCKDGRVSSLCYDGEWHENGAGDGKLRTIMGKGYQAAQNGVKYVYVYYPGEENGGDFRVYTFGPVDFDKPTVGALVPGEGK